MASSISGDWAPGQWLAERILNLDPEEGSLIALSGPHKVAEAPASARILKNSPESAHHGRLRGGREGDLNRRDPSNRGLCRGLEAFVILRR